MCFQSREGGIRDFRLLRCEPSTGEEWGQATYSGNLRICYLYTEVGVGADLQERTLRALTQANGLDFILQVSERR